MRQSFLKSRILLQFHAAEGETGIVYQGKLDFEVNVQEDGDLPKLPIKLMMNVGNPDMAFTFAQIPNDGVGLSKA